MPKQTFGLGRGLGSLIPGRQASSGEAAGPGRKTEDKKSPAPAKFPPAKADYFSGSAFAGHPLDEEVSRLAMIEAPISEISSNKHQPRRYFEDASLRELADSIKERGILQPLIVVKNDASAGYELIAGERRLRAAKMANLRTVPVIVRQAGELERLELALIENIQRADLNPIEEAAAYQKLNDEFGLKQDEIAKRMGKARPTVTNAIRLLSLPDEVKQAIADGRITISHAKTLLEIKDPAGRLALFRQVLQQKLSITDTKGEVNRIQVKTHSRHIRKNPNIIALEDKLRRALGTKVYLRRKGQSAGEIAIEYYGEEELQALMEKLTSGNS